MYLPAVILQKSTDGGSGTLIYVLITLALLVVSMLRGKKKPGTSSGPSKQKPSPGIKDIFQPGRKPGLDSFLSAMLNEEPADTQPVTPMDNVEEEEEITFEEENAPEIEPPAMEGVTAFSEDNPETEIIETGLQQSLTTEKAGSDSPYYVNHDTDSDIKKTSGPSTFLTELLTDIDGRKAIIYSEIINSKYF